MNPEPNATIDAAIREAAAAWVVRRERGLSATESVDFELWLAADKRHAAALQRASATWGLLDRIPEQTAVPMLAAAARRRTWFRFGRFALPLAAAAAILVAFAIHRRAALSDAAPALAEGAGPTVAGGTARDLTLSDGSVVELNAGAEIAAHFTAHERRVTLVHGEAHFSVAHETRPFIVRAAHVEVRAVGTEFNVHLESAAVEVLVTEGVVKLNPSADGARRQVPPAESIPSLRPGQRALVALAPTSPEVAVVVTTVSQDEIARTLAWQEPLLRLDGATLAQVAADFTRRTGRRVVLADPSLGHLRLGGRFRADDVEGFASVVATTLGIEVEHAPDGSLILRRGNSSNSR